MIGFAVASFKENKWGGLISQGIGTSMLQVPNIIKKPVIWLPAIIASAILGPISTTVFKMTNNASGAGMGTAGLVRPDYDMGNNEYARKPCDFINKNNTITFYFTRFNCMGSVKSVKESKHNKKRRYEIATRKIKLRASGREVIKFHFDKNGNFASVQANGARCIIIYNLFSNNLFFKSHNF